MAAALVDQGSRAAQMGAGTAGPAGGQGGKYCGRCGVLLSIIGGPVSIAGGLRRRIGETEGGKRGMSTLVHETGAGKRRPKSRRAWTWADVGGGGGGARRGCQLKRGAPVPADCFPGIHSALGSAPSMRVRAPCGGRLGTIPARWRRRRDRPSPRGHVQGGGGTGGTSCAAAGDMGRRIQAIAGRHRADGGMILRCAAASRTNPAFQKCCP